MDYKQKYLNYKNKYLELKNKQIGGMMPNRFNSNLNSNLKLPDSKIMQDIYRKNSNLKLPDTNIVTQDKKVEVIMPDSKIMQIYKKNSNLKLPNNNIVTQDEKDNLKKELEKISTNITFEEIINKFPINQRIGIMNVIKINENDNEKTILEKTRLKNKIKEGIIIVEYIGKIIDSKEMHYFNILFSLISDEDFLYQLKITTLVLFIITCNTLDDNKTFNIFIEILDDCKNNNIFFVSFIDIFNQTYAEFLNNEINNNNIFTIQDKYLEALFGNGNDKNKERIVEFSKNINSDNKNNKITEYIQKNFIN